MHPALVFGIVSGDAPGKLPYIKPMFQSAAKWEIIDMKMFFFHFHTNKTHFHQKKVKQLAPFSKCVSGTQKLSICHHSVFLFTFSELTIKLNNYMYHKSPRVISTTV